MPGERREEDGQRHDEAADDRRETRRLPPAEGHEEWRHEVRDAQVGRTDPD